ATSRRRSLTGDETNHRLRHVLPDELGGVLLVRSADLAHHRHGFRLRIGLEGLEAVDEVRAVDRVAADPHARRLTHARAAELIHDLVRQCPRPAHDTDVARCADTAGNDADFRLSW